MDTLIDLYNNGMLLRIFMLIPFIIYLVFLVFLIKNDRENLREALDDNFFGTFLLFLIITAIMISPVGWFVIGFFVRAIFKEGPWSVLENKKLKEQVEERNTEIRSLYQRLTETYEENERLETQHEESMNVLRQTRYFIYRLARDAPNQQEQDRISSHIDELNNILNFSRAKSDEFGNDISKEIDNIKYLP